MFAKSKTVQLAPIDAYSDKFFVDSVPRLILLSDDTFVTVSNTPVTAIIDRYDKDAVHLSQTVFSGIAGFIYSVFVSEYGVLYIATTLKLSEYDETLTIYKSVGDKTIEVANFKRESYLHKMAYFNFCFSDKSTYLLLTRHNRLHKYLIKTTADETPDTIEEVDVLEGERWYIDSADSEGYLLGCEGNDSWFLYNTDFDIISPFDYDDRAICVGLSASKDNDVIAITFNSFDNTSTILTYNIADDVYHPFSISYQLFGTKVIGSKIWSLLYNVFSRFEPAPVPSVSGLLILDKYGALQFAHIRDKTGGDLIRAYKPIPIASNALGFQELKDGKLLIIEQNRAIITDITCRELDTILLTNGYNCVVSTDKSKLLALHLTDSEVQEDETIKYKAELEIFTWEHDQKATQIIDIKSFRN